jgi:hypothetical protein
VKEINTKMKYHYGAANPNIDKAVKLSKTYKTTAEAILKNVERSTSRPNKIKSQRIQI